MNKKLGVILLIATFVLSMGAVPVNSAAAISGSGVVLWWHLDENSGSTTADASGNGNTGLLGALGAGDAAEPTWVEGKVGSALSFDGSDDYLHTDNASVVGVMDKTQGTFELWVKPLDLSKDLQAFMVVNTTAGGSNTYSIQYGTDNNTIPGTLYFRVNADGQEVSVVAEDVGFTQDSWHHLAMTWDDSTGVLAAYVDGNPVGSYSGATFNNDLSGDLFVGAWFDTTKNSAAVIDEVRIWDIALTAEQIALSVSGSVVWRPPVTNPKFICKKGRTLPVKFQLVTDAGVVTSVQPVSLTITGPEGFTTKTFVLGKGVKYLRWSAKKHQYIANLKTKIGDWPEGLYTATVVGIVTGQIQFTMVAKVNKGKHKGQKKG